MDKDYFWAKHGKKVIIGGIILLLGIVATIYFVFFYQPPVEPEPEPDVLSTISVEVESTELPMETLPEETMDETTSDENTDNVSDEAERLYNEACIPVTIKEEYIEDKTGKTIINPDTGKSFVGKIVNHYFINDGVTEITVINNYQDEEIETLATESCAAFTDGINTYIYVGDSIDNIIVMERNNYLKYANSTQ